ncbi:MAG: hypothetical protein ACI9JM_000016 [Halioglobus sp.]|jgi:hypothetical protein
MKRFSQPLRAITISALAGSIAFFGSTLANPAAAKKADASGLFSQEPTQTHIQTPRRAKPGKSRSVKIDRSKLRSGRFTVDLPGGVSFEAVRELQQEMGRGRFAWVGHAGNEPGSRAIFGVSGDSIAGTFYHKGKLFKLEPRADGSHVVSEVDSQDPAPELDPIPVFDVSSANASSDSVQSPSADAGGSVIDVLVAYTPAVQSLYGAQGVEALAIQAAAETNQAYANSGMSTRLNLVHSVMTNYAGSGDMGTDLSRLRSTNDGYMDELHALRNAYGADVVSLIENQSQYCGMAYRMSGLSNSFASSAFSVVHHSCATGYYSFGHEIGHNQGVTHDPDNAGSSVFSYAYGYQEPFGSFRTVMAYNCPTGCTRINHFSNPSVFYNGLPTGIEDYTDNARAIDATAATVAGFRQAAIVTLPNAPEDLTAAVDGANNITLHWTDTAGDESGFYLERATDGATFTHVATLPANSSSYADQDLQADTVYTYRIQAWNSNGPSSFSDSVVATTQPDASVVQVAMFGLGLVDSLAGNYLDTYSEDGVSLSIGEILSAGDGPQSHSYLEYYWAFNVQPGESITVQAQVNTRSLTQVFTFAYSTVPVLLSVDPQAWTPMFGVSPWFPSEHRFELPPQTSGLVLISVRDGNRVPGVTTTDSVQIDALTITTQLSTP